MTTRASSSILMTPVEQTEEEPYLLTGEQLFSLLYGNSNNNMNNNVNNPMLEKDKDTTTINNSITSKSDSTLYRFPKWLFSCEYLKLLVKSPVFLFTTLCFSLVSRLMAMADVVTDFDQLYKFAVGIETPDNCLPENVTYTCDVIKPTSMIDIALQPTNATFIALSEASVSRGDGLSLSPGEPFWFSITFFALYLPVLQCILTHPIEQVLFQYCYHRFSLKTKVSVNKLPDWMCKDSNYTVTRQVRPIVGFLLKVLLFPVLPVFVSFRQLRQIVLLIKLEWYQQKINSSIPKEPLNIRESLKKFYSKVCGNSKTDDHSEAVLSKLIHAAMTDEKFEPPKTIQLYDELTRLSEDRLDEAILEATPQSILNLSLIFRYGGDFSQVSLACSFSSLVFAAAQYTEHKLKKNPLKRELNVLGDVISFLATFPSVLSRCTMLAILFSIRNTVAKTLGFISILFGTLVGAVFEYRHLAPEAKKVSVPLLLQLFVRGYISVFTLMEYRTKRFNYDHWEDEADDELRRGISKEPKHRFFHQLFYLFINSLINILFIFAWYYLMCEKICFVEGAFLPQIDEPKLPMLVIVSMGGPLSILFTVIIRLPKVKRVATVLGIKSMAALHFHVVSVVKSGDRHNIERLKETLKPCSYNEISKIDQTRDEEGRSILEHTLHQTADDELKLATFCDYMDLGFPVTKNCTNEVSKLTSRLFKSKRYTVLGNCLMGIVPILDKRGMVMLTSDATEALRHCEDKLIREVLKEVVRLGSEKRDRRRSRRTANAPKIILDLNPSGS